MIDTKELIDIETENLTDLGASNKKRKASEILREMPRSQWSRGSLRKSDGTMCALGYLYDQTNGNWDGYRERGDSLQFSPRGHFESRLSLVEKELGIREWSTEITSLNDTFDLYAVINFLEGLDL